MGTKKTGYFIAAVWLLGAAVAVWLVLAAILAEEQKASVEEPPGTNVWLTAVPKPSGARVSVTVPMVFAFVVNGTDDPNQDTAVTIENNGLLIPNVKVDKGGNGDYTITVEGEPTMVFRNYSTDTPALPGVAPDDPDAPRYGIGVELSATIQDADTTDQWVPIAQEPGTGAGEWKHYRLGVGKNKDNPDAWNFFSTEVTPGDSTRFRLETPVTLGAPPAHIYGWTAGGASNVPLEQEVPFTVQVGGTRGLYHEADTSAKAGQIIWTITPLPLPDPLPTAETADTKKEAAGTGQTDAPADR